MLVMFSVFLVRR